MAQTVAPEASPVSDSAAPVPEALEALLGRGIDYAGLFPPAHLSMDDAVRNYAEYLEGDARWMVGRFIVPSSRLEEFEDAGARYFPRSASHSWALSALVGADVELDISSIDHFNDRHREAKVGAVHVDTVEFKASRVEEIEVAEPFVAGYSAFVEVPVTEDPDSLIAAIARVGVHAKIRTGGVTADAIPGPRHVVRFLRCCLEHEVSFKATAGLHHPMRAEYPLTYEPDAPAGVLYGFVNILLATAFMRAGMDDAQALVLLDERDPNSILVTPEGVLWREHSLSIEELRAGRQEVLAFGSCSVEEPLRDLRAMRWL